MFTGLGLGLALAFGTLSSTCEVFFLVHAGSVEKLCMYLEWQASK